MKRGRWKNKKVMSQRKKVKKATEELQHRRNEDKKKGAGVGKTESKQKTRQRAINEKWQRKGER